MSSFAESLASCNFEVTYVAERILSPERVQQGWSAPQMPSVRLILTDSDGTVQRLVSTTPDNSIHICEGLRSNGRVGLAQRFLARRGLMYWLMMEGIDDKGRFGFLKRFEYARLFRARENFLAGVLTIGYRTPDWVMARGIPTYKVYPFAYFLAEAEDVHRTEIRTSTRYRFIYVGQLISRKLVDLLLRALASIEQRDTELIIVGNGPLNKRLKTLASDLMPGRVQWRGGLPQGKVAAAIAQADCLVLPSRHDGWGAVVSEALMVGTPAICSDACGSAGVVRASGVGGVFSSDSQSELSLLLAQMVRAGPLTPTRRAQVVEWARCLAAPAGARYLKQILLHQSGEFPRPLPPWERSIFVEQHSCK